MNRASNHRHDPERKDAGVIRKAIATLQQQSTSHESALDTLKAARDALVEEFEAMKVRYPREITKLDDKIAIFERELVESKAAVLQLQRMAGEPER